jgi:hypothetical protein
MTDFFDTLELELRAAAARRPRRTPGWHAVGVGGAAAIAAPAIALAVIVALIVLGGGDSEPGVSGEQAGREAQLPPVGTVIPKGEGDPPRPRRSTVVATGSAPLTGPWQLEVSRGTGVKDPETGQVYLKPGGLCLVLFPIGPSGRAKGGGGYCGPPGSGLGFRKTPGFSRSQHTTPQAHRKGEKDWAKEVLVWGRAPERATSVVITAPGGVRIEAATHEGPRRMRGDFYAIPVEPPLPGARVNWLGPDGEPGSRGIRLMPPVTR